MELRSRNKLYRFEEKNKKLELFPQKEP
jgi:hypothetical protein